MLFVSLVNLPGITGYLPGDWGRCVCLGTGRCVHCCLRTNVGEEDDFQHCGVLMLLNLNSPYVQASHLARLDLSIC